MHATKKGLVGVLVGLGLVAGGVFLTCQAWAETPTSSALKPPYDGFIDEREACEGGEDIYSQDLLFRPWGGVLLVAPSLSADKRAAITAAAATRLAATGAVWRMVDATGPLGVGLDAIFVGSCGFELPGFSYLTYRPSGSLGVRWAAKPPAEWAAGIAQSLALAEGDGPL